jgi:hypothetical protein
MSVVVRLSLIAAAGLMALSASLAAAQPASFQLTGVTHIYQDWNNCGPAALTMGMTFFGYPADQYPAAQWLKPNSEDKNVSPWQMVAYVNEQSGTSIRALYRHGGTMPLIKTLLSHQFPVLVEAGYDPPQDAQGWMGHYLLVTGWDDSQGVFFTQDSFNGPNHPYPYAYFDEFWRHFNRLYIVLYPAAAENQVLALLGADADPRQNYANAFRAAQQEAIANPNDPFAWFNMGTSLVGLEMYVEAAAAYDRARAIGLPWRMLWYQFGMYEAYYHVGRYDDVLALARAKLEDGGGQYVEETFYYGGLARAARGEIERAMSNFNGAIAFNPNFTPAREARARLQGG